jgi:hypothetical protein
MLDWLRRLTSTGQAPSASIPRGPSTRLPGADPFPDVPVEIARHEVIPAQLGVTVFAWARASHQGPVDIWMLLTDGLWREGHPEVLLCVKRQGEARDAWPRGILQLVVLIYEAAHKRAAPLTAGEVLSVEGGDVPGLFQAAKLGGLALTHANVPRGMMATAPWVQAVPLTEEEVFTATRYGVVRVLSALGWAVREFPTLPWHDALRAEAGIPPGLLDPVPRGRLIGVLGCLLPREPLPLAEIDAHGCDTPYDLSRGRWFARLEIPLSQVAGLHRLLDDLGPGRTFALLLDPDPDARAVLRRTDTPGSLGIMIGHGPLTGSVRFGLNHVAFFRTNSGDSSALLEDGLGVFLSEPSMAALHSALRSTEPILLSQPEFALEICWTESDYTNPFTDQVLTRPYQYHVLPVSAALAHCNLVSVGVFGSRQELASNANEDAFLSLIAATTRTVDRWAATLPPWAEGAVLIVEQAVSDSGRRFRMAYQPLDLESCLGVLLEELYALPAVGVVQHGQVTTHLTYQVQSGREGSQAPGGPD